MNTNTDESTAVNVQEFLDNQRFSRFHWLVFVMCFLVVAMDGFDTSVMGYIVPSLIQDWHVPKASLGPVLSAALIGLGIGAAVAGPIADRIGRKSVMVVSVFFFGVWSLVSSRVTSMDQLIVLRFLTGLGLGASMPNAVALMSEYAPKRIRGIAVNAMFTGYSITAGLCGLIAAYMLPRFGWQGVLFAGGVAPVLISLCLIPLLPESLKFMIARQRATDKISALLRRVASDKQFEGQRFVVESAERGGFRSARNPIAELFSAPYWLGTVMLWVGYFMFLAVFFMLTNWTPTLFRVSGLSLHAAETIGSMIHFGGTVGLLCAGFLMDRFRPAFVIAAFAALTAMVLAIIGHSLGHAVWLMGTLIFLSGFCLSAGLGSMAPFAADYYPTTSRVTGTSWMLAVGRFGAVGGAWGGAILNGLGWQFGQILSVLALPMLIAAVALVVVGRGRVARTSGAGRSHEMARLH